MTASLSSEAILGGEVAAAPVAVVPVEEPIPVAAAPIEEPAPAAADPAPVTAAT